MIFYKGLILAHFTVFPHSLFLNEDTNYDTDNSLKLWVYLLFVNTIHLLIIT